MKNKLLIFLVVVLCAGMLSAAVFADNHAADWLKEYYGISFDGDVSAADFNDALASFGIDPLDIETLTLADAVVGAVRLANMEEMVLTFGTADEDELPDDDYAPYLAFALAHNWVEDDDDFAGPISAEIAAEMLYDAAEMSGNGRRYVGRISDDNILTKLIDMIGSSMIFDEEKLMDAGIDLLLDEATTGYSLKYAGYYANFLEENTLRYGHDSAAHLLQLVSLMKALGYDAYVQVEPKVSVYEYLLEWGLPGDPTPTYAVREMVEGRYYAFAMEFDAAFEFDSKEQKESFHELIETYAKIYDNSFDEDGNLVKPLLVSSWWQPLYFSSTEMENKEFMPLIDNMIFNGPFVIHSFSVPENSALIAESFTKSDPDLVFETRTIYVNPAFYRYITGTDHQ